MNKKDLLKEELSNLYAICKQVNSYMNGSEIDFLTEKHQLLLMDYLKAVCQCEDNTSTILSELDINPTNTTDSIVNEITDNLKNIIVQDIDNDVKAPGYLLSLNRLMNYQLANLENIQYISTDEVNMDILNDLKGNFQKLKNNLLN